MNYDKLVKALRVHASVDIECYECAYYDDCCINGNGHTKMMADAAAAIEALQAELEKKRTADCFGCKCDKLEPSGRLQKRGKPVLLAASSMNGCEKLPKRGEWITHPEVKNIYGGVYIECPFCGEKYVVQNVSDEKFCRNCGADLRAKMEVQE